MSAPADPPPFKLTRESKIRIDREGHLWHEAERILHEGLALGLLRWLAVDPTTDRYVLRNAIDWCFITVDDAPLVVRTLAFGTLGGAPQLTLSDGTEEPLDADTLRIDGDDVPYCDVHDRALPARFSRQAAFALLETCSRDSDPEALTIAGKRTAVRRVARGDGAPHREPAHPETA